ncbi:MAG TPA: AmmeMemoRadiSam system protein A [Terriglobales bacterium]|jgi:AmmeMemoRadiSam system protein A
MSQPFEFSKALIFSRNPEPEYSTEERTLLLELAHESIQSALQNREIEISVLSPHLSEPRGVFTTIFLNGALRGCVGFPNAILPVHRAVVETARAAASDDPRFRPIRMEEAPRLKISVSVLSSLKEISADAVEIGLHGVVISGHGHRGLLLPQVPVEHGWDRITFLEQTCLKAGLSPDAWRKDAHIEAFTAEVFSDS